MNLKTTHYSIRPVASALVAGVLALGLSGAAMAHGGSRDDHGRSADRYGDHRSATVIHNHYYGKPKKHLRRKARHNKYHHRAHRRGHGHGHGHGHRPVREVVYVREHYQSAPRAVVYEEPERSYRRPARDTVNTGRRSQLNAGSLMGAAIGGLIGSQIGGGSGKLAATAAGSVGGFLLGDHATHGYR